MTLRGHNYMDLHSHGVHNYGLDSYDLGSYGPYRYGLHSYGLQSRYLCMEHAVKASIHSCSQKLYSQELAVEAPSGRAGFGWPL